MVEKNEEYMGTKFCVTVDKRDGDNAEKKLPAKLLPLWCRSECKAFDAEISPFTMQALLLECQPTTVPRRSTHWPTPTLGPVTSSGQVCTVLIPHYLRVCGECVPPVRR